MGHFTCADLPFYHALADAFTIGNQYFCSVHGPTRPNRLFLFSGTSGLAVGAGGEQCVHTVDDGNWTAEIARDKARFAGWRWTTYAEWLSKAGCRGSSTRSTIITTTTPHHETGSTSRSDPALERIT